MCLTGNKSGEATDLSVTFLMRQCDSSAPCAPGPAFIGAPGQRFSVDREEPGDRRRSAHARSGAMAMNPTARLRAFVGSDIEGRTHGARPRWTALRPHTYRGQIRVPG